MDSKTIKQFLPVFFRALILIVYFAFVQVPFAFSTSTIEPWDDAVFEAIAKEYGEAAGNRMRARFTT
jgi:hypothetical protein